MKFVNVRELNIETAKVLDEAQNEDIVVTVHGKPKVLIRRFSEDDIEDYVIGKAMEARLREHPEEYEPGTGIPLEALIQKTRKETMKRVRR